MLSLAVLLVLVPMPVLLLALLAMAMQVLAVFALMPEMPTLVLQAVLIAMIFEYKTWRSAKLRAWLAGERWRSTWNQSLKIGTLILSITKR